LNSDLVKTHFTYIDRKCKAECHNKAHYPIYAYADCIGCVNDNVQIVVLVVEVLIVLVACGDADDCGDGSIGSLIRTESKYDQPKDVTQT